MARRRSSERSIFLLFAASAILIWLTVQILERAGGAIVLLVIVAAIGFAYKALIRPPQVRKAALMRVDAVIEQHMDALVRRRAQLVRSDPYGKLQRETWVKEIEYFVAHHLRPALSTAELSALVSGHISLPRIVDARVEGTANSRPVFQQFSKDLTPTDFELFCAEQLKTCGWNARVTTQSRDQGVDVIAEKTGIRVVLQCKLYSNPVGNKAVQEIVAGRAYERAHYGAVVTNTTYTSPAQQLAATNNILLLHYQDLPKLEELLAGQSR